MAILKQNREYINPKNGEKIVITGIPFESKKKGHLEVSKVVLNRVNYLQNYAFENNLTTIEYTDQAAN